MSSFAETLLLPGLFLLTLLLLAWFSRRISVDLQLATYYLTRSKDAPTIAVFLVFLPGVVVHETAHWGVAKLLGLRTGKFRVWPKKQGRHIGLGSVTVESRNVVLDAIVGIAPLLAGSALAAWIANQLLDAAVVTDRLAQGQILGSLTAFWRGLGNPDGGIWAYLLFAIANAMMPSASDREPIKPVVLYAAGAALLYALLGMPLAPVAGALAWLTPVIELLVSAFLFTILLDAGVVLLLGVIKALAHR